MRRYLNGRLAVIALLAFAVGCFTISFAVHDTVTGQVQFQGDHVDQALGFDLSSSSELQSHLSHVESFNLQNVTVTVTSVASDNSVSSVTGTLSLRPSADGGVDPSNPDVALASLNAFAITQGNSLTIPVAGQPGAAAVETFWKNELAAGDLKGAVVLDGTSAGNNGDFTLQVVLNAEPEYNPL
jgi:hypothetical protein